MSFDDLSFENFIPDYLNPEIKDRIKLGLQSFFHKDSNEREKNYDGFYALDAPDYLMQSDVFQSVRSIDWDFEQNDFVNCYFTSILVSNTCDLSNENERATNIKQALFAPIIPVEEYLKDMEQADFKREQIEGFYNSLRRQEHSNLFYLPKNHKNGRDYIVFLDKIFWQPAENLLTLSERVNEERFLSLSNWGFYLFILKVSYHLCRLPETYDGRLN